MAPRCLTVALLAAALAYTLATTAVTTTGFATATPAATVTATMGGASAAAATHGATSAANMHGASAIVNVTRVSAPGGCEEMKRATDFNRWCVKGGGITSDTCCKTLLEAVESGGLMCLCDIAMTPTVLTSGYGALSILEAYSSCGGPLPIGSVNGCD